MPNNFKMRPNTLKRISNRTIKCLENNSRVIVTKNIISKPKIVTNKPKIVNKTEVVGVPKIFTKPEVVIKLKKVNKAELVNKKRYDEYRKRVKRQSKSLFDSKKRIIWIMIMKNTEQKEI